MPASGKERGLRVSGTDEKGAKNRNANLQRNTRTARAFARVAIGPSWLRKGLVFIINTDTNWKERKSRCGVRPNSLGGTE